VDISFKLGLGCAKARLRMSHAVKKKLQIIAMFVDMIAPQGFKQ
jgi:hypothetical protein